MRAPGGLWMVSWQSRDSFPICCGWLCIPVARHPQFPRCVHEAIHADGGQGGFSPQPSTGVHTLSTTFSTVILSHPDRGRRRVETVCMERPHAIHGAPELSTRLSTGLWARDGWWGRRHERALMHTRAELSTNTGVLSTLARGALERCVAERNQ